MKEDILNIFEKKIDYQMRLKSNFNNIYDLSYSLIDFHALLSGFYKTITTIEYEEQESSIKKDDLEKEEYSAINFSIKDKEIKELDIVSSKHILNPKHVKTNKRNYPTTSRKFSAQYKNNLEMVEFSQGSFISSLCVSIISALFIEFIKRQINSETGTSIIETQIINNIFIYEENGIKEIIKAPVESQSSKLYDMDVNSLIKTTISKVKFNSKDSSKSLESFLEVLSNEEFIREEVCYNRRGQRTIINDIDRFKGNLFNKTF